MRNIGHIQVPILDDQFKIDRIQRNKDMLDILERRNVGRADLDLGAFIHEPNVLKMVSQELL